jgi:hypothetical protein
LPCPSNVKINVKTNVETNVKITAIRRCRLHPYLITR